MKVESLLKIIACDLDALEKAIAIEAPDDYRFRFKENLREAMNAVCRMKKAYEEFSLSADYRK